MKTIYKYTLPEFNTVKIEMPKDAWILHLDTQDGKNVVLWALVDTEAELEERTFYCYLTGHSIEQGLLDIAYIGTVLQYGGSFVVHVFEDSPSSF